MYVCLSFKKTYQVTLNYLIAGVQKSGTTTLNHCLSQHDAICTYTDKEVHFFDNEANFIQPGNVDYKAYHANFTPQSNQIIGEATPIYLYWHNCLERIKAYNPNIKLIITLRNPVDRAYSQWQMIRNRNQEPLSFRDAIYHEQERLENLGQNGQHRDYSYLDRGNYATQLKRLFSIFDRDQIHFVKADDMLEDMDVVLYKIFNFLELPFQKVDTSAKHIGDYEYSLDPVIRNQLVRYFEDEIIETESLLKWNCSDWKKEVSIPKHAAFVY